MYLSGLGAGPFLRAFIFVPPGSNQFGPYASVCGSLPNGCYNTGRVDMGAPVGQACLNPDPQQFDNFQSMAAYAAAHQESLKEFSSVQAINSFCSTAGAAPVTAAPTPSVPPPTITQTPSGGYINPGATSSGSGRFPTGIATPSAPPPTVVVTGSPGYLGPPDAAPVNGGAPAEASVMGMSPLALLLIAGLGVGFLMKK